MYTCTSAAPASGFGVTAFSPLFAADARVDGCPVYLDNPVFWLPLRTLGPDGSSTQALTVPDDPVFAGALVYFQDFLFVPAGRSRTPSRRRTPSRS